MAAASELLRAGVRGASDDTTGEQLVPQHTQRSEVRRQGVARTGTSSSQDDLYMRVMPSAIERKVDDQSTGGMDSDEPEIFDPRLFPFDVVKATGANVKYGAGQEGVMDAVTAGRTMSKILETCLGKNAPDGDQYALVRSLFLTQALNGSSVLQPGGVFLHVAGRPRISYEHVKKILGADARKFYRAYASTIVKTVKHVLSNYDRKDPDSVATLNAILRIAGEKGLLQYPEYISDVAEYCGAPPAVHTALRMAKQDVLSSTPNAVIKRIATGNVVTREDYPGAGEMKAG